MNTETYNPVRDHKFFYASEACDYIEARQCVGCGNAKPQPDMPGGSCPVLLNITLQNDLVGILGEGPDVVETEDGGIMCTRQTNPGKKLGLHAQG